MRCWEIERLEVGNGISYIYRLGVVYSTVIVFVIRSANIEQPAFMFFEQVESRVKSIRTPQTILLKQDLDARACAFGLYVLRQPL